MVYRLDSYDVPHSHGISSRFVWCATSYESPTTRWNAITFEVVICHNFWSSRPLTNVMHNWQCHWVARAAKSAVLLWSVTLVDTYSTHNIVVWSFFYWKRRRYSGDWVKPNSSAFASKVSPICTWHMCMTFVRGLMWHIIIRIETI